jgi:hypothetical protein
VSEQITILTLNLPLPITLVAELMRGIREAAERAGYTDLALTTDGTSRVVARRKETP